VKGILVAAVVVALAGASPVAATRFPAPESHLPAAGLATWTPNLRTCDPNADTSVMCVKHASPSKVLAGTPVFSGPRAGRVFTGGYVWISDRVGPAEWKVSCDAKVGGRLAWDGGTAGHGDLYFAGGVRLTPILRRYAASVTVGGNRYTTLVTCGWRIPRSVSGKLLSLVRPRGLVPCDVSCDPWGLHFEAGGGLKECNQTTWRVRGHDSSIGRNTPVFNC
jgi:hypothetical protein